MSQPEKSSSSQGEKGPQRLLWRDVETLLDRPIAYHRVFAKIGKGKRIGANAALFLSQALFWSQRTSDPNGWFYKSQDDWEEETGLSRYEQETARRNLKAEQLIEEDRRGIPARLYYRIDRINLIIALEMLSDRHSGPQDQAQADAPIQNVEIPQSRVRTSPNQVSGQTTSLSGANPQSFIETKNTAKNKQRTQQQAHKIETPTPVVDVVDSSNLLTTNGENHTLTFWPHAVPDSISDSALLLAYSDLPVAVRRVSESHLLETQPHLKVTLKSAAGDAHRIALMRSNWPQKLHDLSTQLVAVKTKDGRATGMTIENLAPLVAADFEIAERFLNWFPHYEGIDKPARALRSMLTNPEKWPEPESFTLARQTAEQSQLQANATARAAELAQARAVQEKASASHAAQLWPTLTDSQKERVQTKMRCTPRGAIIVEKVALSGGIENFKDTAPDWLEFFALAGSVLEAVLTEAATNNVTPQASEVESEIEDLEDESSDELPPLSELPSRYAGAVNGLWEQIADGVIEPVDLEERAEEFCEKFGFDEVEWDMVKAEVKTRLGAQEKKVA